MSLFDTGTDFDPSIMLPNRYNDLFKRVDALCPCGASVNVTEGTLGTHTPVMYPGRPASLKDPFGPGPYTGCCRYAGRSVTLEAAIARDEAMTKAEKNVAYRVQVNPAAWLGLLNWVALADVAVGDRIGFTQVEQPDPYGPRIAVERAGTVKRRGKTFAVITCDEDEYAAEVRLTAKMWDRARPRRK